jgi:hypothetical protein
MKKTIVHQWGAVLGLSLLLIFLKLHLMQSALAKIVNSPAMYLLTEQTEEELIGGPEFRNSMKRQLQNVKFGSTNYDFTACSDNLLNPDEAVDILRTFIDQTNVTDIEVITEEEKMEVLLTLNTDPPMEFTYYISCIDSTYTLDSITGIDEVLIHLSEGSEAEQTELPPVISQAY